MDKQVKTALVGGAFGGLSAGVGFGIQWVAAYLNIDGPTGIVGGLLIGAVAGGFLAMVGLLEQLEG